MNELPYTAGRVNSALVYNDNGKKAMMMAVSRHHNISPHSSPADALAIIIEGVVEVTLNNTNYILRRGDSILFRKNEIHSLQPVTDFKMYLVKY